MALLVGLLLEDSKFRLGKFTRSYERLALVPNISQI